MKFRCRGARSGRVSGYFRKDGALGLGVLMEMSSLSADDIVRAASTFDATASLYEALIAGLLRAGHKELASTLDRETREPCGNDLTDQVAEVPADGSPYSVICEKCGKVSLVRKT